MPYEEFLTIILAQHKEEEIYKTMRDQLPSEMTKFKFLLNPVRLNIIKLLYDNFHLTSIQIKENLNLTWSDYSHNILALEEKGYVSTEVSFQRGLKRNLVYLEERGRLKYESLIELLHEFLQTTNDQYLSKFSKDSRMYPTS